MRNDMTPEEYLQRVLTTQVSDNCPMRRTLEKLGFTYCGTILCDDVTPRRAYQKDL